MKQLDADPVDWESEWETGDTGWDAGESAPGLREFVASTNQRYTQAIAPGCGSGYDLVELAKLADRVVGVDLAAGAKAGFEAKHEDRASIEYCVQDFFSDKEPVVSGEFDLGWDYTFLCAIPPSWRARWAKRYGELIRPGGHLLVLMFPLKSPEWTMGDGPPHQVEPSEIEALLDEAGFALQEKWNPKASHPRRGPFERLYLFRRV